MHLVAYCFETRYFYLSYLFVLLTSGFSSLKNTLASFMVMDVV